MRVELFFRDRPQRERLHERAETAHRVRLLEQLERVATQRAPARAHRVAHGIEVERADAPQVVVRRSVRPREEGVQCRPEAWGRGERRQPERVDEHEAVESIAVLRREARCDGATQRDSHQRRPRVARLLDQRVEPGDHVGCRPTPGRSRRSLSRQVRRDHAVCLRERRDDAAPMQGVRHGAVQQHDRRAFAPDQHRRRHARALEPPVLDRQPRGRSDSRLVEPISSHASGS